MQTTLTDRVRASFLAFFERRGHRRVPSEPVLALDPSLLFTAAGMVPLRDYFTGAAEPPADALTSAQLCLRAGGKHNDLDAVGLTARHHTAFEMLGNFSFGAYGRERAIAMAWEFVTGELGVDPERLHATYHHTDDASRRLWQSMGLPASRVQARGDVDNYWSAGASGPRGPCTELFVDTRRGATDDERYLEICNRVFMDRQRSATDGTESPLARPCVDTGMGLERMATVLADAPSNYDAVRGAPWRICWIGRASTSAA